MRKYNYYKHDNCTDLVIEPVRVIYLHKPERIKVKAKLYTCGYPGRLLLQDIDEFVIEKENYNKWKLWELSDEKK